MITCRLYKDGVLKEEAFDPSRASDLITESRARVWLDLEEPTDQELAMIQEEVGLHPLAIEDTRNRNQRPKVDVYEGDFFVVVQCVTLDAHDALVASEV